MPERPRTYRLAQAPRPEAKRVSSAALGYGRAWQATRLRILRRDHYLCQECRRPAGKSAHCDHITTRAAGGGDDDANLHCLCARCHSKKTVREDGGFGR